MDLRTEWVHSLNGIQKWVYKLKATPINKLFHKEGSHHVGTSPIRGEWQARMENELHRASMLGTFDALGNEEYSGHV